MRGIVTLAAALALPVTTAAGVPFPHRAEIILISFSVILVTLVLQGLSLKPVICALRLQEDRELEQEEMRARERAAASAMARLEKLAGENWPFPEHLERMRIYYSQRLRRFAPSSKIDSECTLEAAESFRRLMHEMLNTERRTVIELRNQGVISDEVLHRIEHELDIEALRLDVGERPVTA
jgi:CPA1 family monovalent cation:H+ antiporter